MEKQLNRVNKILRHPLWIKAVEQINDLEKKRIFCSHNIDHFLHVARIAYIESLEKGMNISKELIYATALLHDIGRGMQYEQDIPHDLASVAMARTILPECGFSHAEMTEIINAIAAHRDADTAGYEDLRGIIYRADKLSRNCFKCPVMGKCNWDNDRKNRNLRR